MLLYKKIVAHDFRYDPRKYHSTVYTHPPLQRPTFEIQTNEILFQLLLAILHRKFSVEQDVPSVKS